MVMWFCFDCQKTYDTEIFTKEELKSCICGSRSFTILIENKKRGIK
jgi:hypothetical protein